MSKKLIKDYKCKYRHYGEITVPKGTKVTSMTASGFDDHYNFVDEFDWIDKNYPAFSNILKMEMKIYGLDIPKKLLTD